MKGPKPRNLAERFWKKVDTSGGDGACWPWIAGTDGKRGYGRIGTGSRTDKSARSTQAQRVAWTLMFGPIDDDICVCRHCDNPPCCNPKHLFLGNRAANLADMTAKGRRVRGETNGCAKLTSDQVREILVLSAKSSLTSAAIGARYGVGGRAVRKIALGQRWAHIDRGVAESASAAVGTALVTKAASATIAKGSQ